MKNCIITIGIILFLSNTLIAQKQQVKRADDLPRRTVPLAGKVMDIYNNDQLLDELAGLIYNNLLNDLEKFEIQDRATLISYYSNLLLFEFRAGKYDILPTRIDQLRNLENKEEEKLTTGLNLFAQLEALKIHPLYSEGFCRETGKNYLHNLQKLPFEKIEKYVINSRNRMQMLNKEATLASLSNQLQPYIDNGKGQVMEQIATAIISTKFTLELSLALRQDMLFALNTYFEANKGIIDEGSKSDIWSARNVALKPNFGKPVIVGIWDTGVDTSLFPGQLFVNDREALNGDDDDKNGFIDDINGIAFDIENKRTTGDLQEERTLTHTKEDLLKWTKGSMDLQHGVDSPEATELQQKAISLTKEKATPFQEDLAWYGTYAHGTHVAGIAVSGNPLARLLYTRLSYETTTFPQAPNQTKHENTIAMFNDIVAYWQQAGVRVVNISLRFSPIAYEALLNMHGIGENEKERKDLAQKWFQAEKKAMTTAFAGASDILFICGAGNEANDAGFADYIPASIDLPNLLTVGAVDAQGKRTTFTTEGENVKLFANGYDVESFVPGGKRVSFNGTSMAAPQVTNLAAKMIAVNPELKPTDIVQIIYQTSTSSQESDKIRLIHPRNALEKALRMRGDFSAEYINASLRDIE